MTLKIEDLDEFEGTTADMVRAWLRKEGWREEPRGGWTPPGRQIEGGLRVICMADVITPTDGIPEMLTAIQHYTKRSVQSLLREINPRTRAGWPTDEELERHAFWMVRTLSDDGIRVLGAYVAREWKRAGIKVECWPCDQRGNKTRRGA